MSKSNIQIAYDVLMESMEGMAKDAKGWKVTDISAVRNMTSAIVELKAENQALRDELEAVKAGMNKIKADAIREAVQQCVFSHNQGIGVFGEGFDSAICQYDNNLEEYANQVEKGQ